jgi:hypothetical protein
METLIFGLIASYCAHRPQKWVIAEPEEFRTFDLQALRNSADNKPSQSLAGLPVCNRQVSHLSPAASGQVWLGNSSPADHS